MTKRKYSNDDPEEAEKYRTHTTNPRTWSVHKALRMRAIHGRRYNGQVINSMYLYYYSYYYSFVFMCINL